jgi:hypothetical protein
MRKAQRTRRFCGVPEAAKELGISRSAAYELANAWLKSNGADGLPCLKLGRRIVVPTAVLDEWATVGLEDNPSTEDVAG